MADRQVGNIHGVTAINAPSGVKEVNQSGSATATAGSALFDADLADIAAMRTRLAAINGALYTDAYLNTMTTNDMVYAIRLNDNPGTF